MFRVYFAFPSYTDIVFTIHFNIPVCICFHFITLKITAYDALDNMLVKTMLIKTEQIKYNDGRIDHAEVLLIKYNIITIKSSTNYISHAGSKMNAVLKCFDISCYVKN